MDTIWLALYIFTPLIVLVGIPAMVLAIGLWIERDHRANLDYRRREVGHVLITDLRSYPGMAPEAQAPEMIMGEVVLGGNVVLATIGRLRMLFGGEVRAFHSLMTRARQEAVMRVMEQAAARGYDAVCNLRLEAIDISGQSTRSANKQGRSGLHLAIMAYGMAYRRAPGVYPPAAPPTLMDYPQ